MYKRRNRHPYYFRFHQVVFVTTSHIFNSERGAPPADRIVPSNPGGKRQSSDMGVLKPKYFPLKMTPNTQTLHSKTICTDHHTDGSSQALLKYGNSFPLLSPSLTTAHSVCVCVFTRVHVCVFVRAYVCVCVFA